MAITIVNSQGTIFNSTSANVDTSGLIIGDICFVLIAKQSANVAVTPPAGWTVLIDNGNKLFNTFAKAMAVGGDITATNTFSFPNGRGAILALAFRGGDTNILTTYQKAMQAGTHVPVVDWPALSGMNSAIFIGFADTFDASGNAFGTISPLPAGYTDSGVGNLGYGIGTGHDIRLFYALNVTGAVDPPNTAPGAGFNNDFGYTSGSFDFAPLFLGAATLAGTGDLGATGLTTALGAATLPGVGDLSAIATTPLCQFPYIAYNYAGAFFCTVNLGNFVDPIGSNIRNLCITDC